MRNDKKIRSIRRGSSPVFAPQFLKDKNRESGLPKRVNSYCYRNYTICFSIEQDSTGPVRLLSIAPHGADLSPLPDSEVFGMLQFFGFEEQVPLESWETGLSQEADMGYIRYYMQPASVFPVSMLN